ncbi:MAG: T9SS type A sorting domain-containing protein [candidate division WOR-3 bacterium]|uniref:T9SS type A sorting domain-containing protein n=1 Tax=candidate division WOR-3 bacterium TaxID=2052148 RepID=A0A7C1NHI5_UNCW3|nr:T9SS type A sorting domain-containing protein [candidate division WOR-3 bacterium]
MSPDNPEVIFTCGYGYINNAYRIQTSYTTDNGTTWIRDTIMDSIARVNACIFDPFVPNRILLGGDSIYNYKLLLVSTDLGNTWEHTGNGLSGIVYSLAASVRTPGLMYAGTSQGFYRSTDGGASWNRTGTFTMVRSVVIDPANDSLIYAGTSTGIFRTSDGGATWVQDNEGLEVTDILTLAFRGSAPRMIFAGTNGGGVYVTTPPTGIGEVQSGAAFRPAKLQVLPNPVRGEFQVFVDGDAGELVQGAIYDPSGRLVHTLTPQIAGSGRVHWLVNMRGCGKGVYFLRVQARTGEVTGRVVLTD